MKKLLFLIILIISVIDVFAQVHGTLTGKITSIIDNEELEGVIVYVCENENIIAETTSNFDGIYTITLLPGTYTVSTAQMGYYMKEKKEIEIIIGKTTELNFELYDTRFENEIVFDTIVIKAIEVNNLDVRFDMILDNHIKLMHKKLIFNKKKYYCVFYIDNDFSVFYKNIFKNYIQNIDSVIDSVYDNYNSFKEYDFDYDYCVGIRTLHRQSRGMNTIKTYKNKFFYKYKGWDILFISNINIDFPNSGKIKELEFIIKNYFTDAEDLSGIYGANFKECSSSYLLNNYSVTQRNSKILFDNGCVPMPKKYLKLQQKN